jgi:WD40 repeat protein
VEWLAPEGNGVHALAISPDGKTLASGAGIGQDDIKLWDADSGERIGTLTGQGDDEWTMSP